MTSPAWISPILAAAMLVIAGGSAIRLALWRHTRHTAPDVDALHALMAIAMAGMLEPRLSPAPAWAWQALFGVTAAWFAMRAFSKRNRSLTRQPLRLSLAVHVLESAAMIYMLVPARSTKTASAAMPGMATATSANPVVTLLFMLFMTGYILWTADQLTCTTRRPQPRNPATTVVETGARSQRLVGCQKIAMSAAMSYMLVTML